MAFEFAITDRVISGEDALKASIPYIKALGKKALIVSGPNNYKLGNVAILESLLDGVGTEHVVFSDIDGEPTNTMIDKGVKIYKKENCDFLIGIGGGSPLDAIKAIGLLAVTGKKVSDYMGKTITDKIPNMAAIPTTAGTGSETTQFTVITDQETDIKMLLKGPTLVPDIAVLDPAFIATAPPSVIASTGLDAFTHAVEAFTSKKAQPLTDVYALSAIKRIMKWLPVLYKDSTNQQAAMEMGLAAFEAGVTINNSSVTLVHGMSRPIGALFHVPHGLANAMLLHTCLNYAVEGSYERFGMLGKELGLADASEFNQMASYQFLAAMDGLITTCEIPTLSEYGVNTDVFLRSIDKMSTDAIDSGSPGNTRREIAKEDVMELYKKVISQ